MRHENIDTSQWIDPDERVEYYLNYQKSINLNLDRLFELKARDFWTQKEVNYISFSDFKHSFIHWYTKYLMHLPHIRDIRTLPFYEKYRDLHSIIDFLKPFNVIKNDIEKFKFPIFYGEHGSTEELPVIRKSRKVEDTRGIVYDLRSLRYNGPCTLVDQHDIPWEKKNNNVIWRGATTGESTRENFVKNYANEFNIGFSSTKQKPHLKLFQKNRVSIKDQLKSKFIVSLQGNDLASNIRWVLHSNSVLVMPEPKWTSWTMETKLIPGVHYLQLNSDLSNLHDLLEWANANDKQCRAIALNGKSFVAQFLDQTHDLPVRMNLLKEYARRVRINESQKAS